VLLIIFFIVLFPLSVFCKESETSIEPPAESVEQSPDSDELEIFTLEDIEVIEKKETTEYITQDMIDITGSTNLWEIMGTIPGVTLTGGSQRNESNFRLRGFNASRVPVYIDGVPQAVPYRGDADHGRILTQDLESIEVQKGYSSMLLGSNNLGGSVNLTVAKPKEKLEARASYTVEYDSKFARQSDLFTASAGTRQELYYLKVTGVYFDQTHFRLSEDFEPQNDYQPDRVRRDSEAEDSKLTFLAGMTPFAGFTADAAYIRQRADKKAPGDVSAPNPRLWDWPKWNRDTVSLNMAYEKEVGYYGKVLAYYDKYENRLFTERPHGIPSDYDDYAAGVKVQGGYNITGTSDIQLSAIWKTDFHRGYDNLTGILAKEVEIEEYTYSLGAEYSLQIMPPLTLTLGAGYDILSPEYYWTSYLGRKEITAGDILSAFVYQAGIFYNIDKSNEVHFTYARKAHFPTMSERFSTRFDTVLPNPDLKPEYAYHYEIGYKGYVAETANITAALYLSDFKDKIYQESVRDNNTGQTVSHSVNKDKWQYYGFEISSSVFLGEIYEVGGMLSLNRSISKYDDVRDTYYPKVTGNLYAVITPTENFRVIPRFEFTGKRWATDDPDDSGSALGEYYLLHLSARVNNIFGHLFAEAAVSNILDKNYEIRQYFPMSGRVYSITVGGKI
jgi:iron complex outermembrane receptor protein